MVARVAFIGSPDDDQPEVMGSLEIGTGPDRVDVGLELVRTGVRDPAGACVGVAVPDRGDRWGPDVAYIGVLPEHRGRGYGHDLLAEATRLLVEAAGTEITGAADAANPAMVTAFTRCGYRVVDRLLVHV